MYEGKYGPSYLLNEEPGSLPQDVYEVALGRPLGIMFEENDFPKKGVKVIGVVDDSNAAQSGRIAEGDQLVGVTGIRVQGAKFERQMCDATKMDYDTVVDAVGSNSEKFNCEDVILRFRRPPAA